MLRYLLKIFTSAILITLVSEISKRTSWIGGLIASLPLTSLLAIIWLYLDTKDIQKISALSWDIFFFVIPSLVFFIFLPTFLERFKFSFLVSMLLSSGITLFAYWVFGLIMTKVKK